MHYVGLFGVEWDKLHRTNMEALVMRGEGINKGC